MNKLVKDRHFSLKIQQEVEDNVLLINSAAGGFMTMSGLVAVGVSIALVAKQGKNSRNIMLGVAGLGVALGGIGRVCEAVAAAKESDKMLSDSYNSELINARERMLTYALEENEVLIESCMDSGETEFDI